jgi:hypothetical protein
VAGFLRERLGVIAHHTLTERGLVNRKYFHLSPAIPPAWGGYGIMLIHGMSPDGRTHHGLLQLERSGPFIPPLSVPGLSGAVVANDFRRALEQSQLTGLGFQPVVKKHIVEHNWQSWSEADFFASLQATKGEPEDLIRSYPHSPATADAMGELWEIWPPECKAEMREEGLVLLRPSLNKLDFVRAFVDWHRLFVSERAKDWLEERVGEFIRFRECRVGEA